MEALTPEQFLKKYFGKSPSDIEISEEMKELKGSAKEISEKKKQTRRDELEDMDSSDLSKAFGLDS